jgi:hypothetical protein
VDPVPDPLLFFLVVPGIEPGPPDVQPRTLTTRPQRRSPTPHNYILRSEKTGFAFDSAGIARLSFVCLTTNSGQVSVKIEVNL